MPRGYISIGSNIDRDNIIPSSLRALKQQFGELIISSIYETGPIGFIGAPFYNLVVGFDSDLEIKTVGKILKKMEEDHGRVPGGKKFSARLIKDFRYYHSCTVFHSLAVIYLMFFYLLHCNQKYNLLG